MPIQTLSKSGCGQESKANKKNPRILIHYLVIVNLIFSGFSLNRIGFIGNPSDGFNGKTISLSISNFWADVTIMESAKLVSGSSISSIIVKPSLNADFFMIHKKKFPLVAMVTSKGGGGFRLVHL